MRSSISSTAPAGEALTGIHAPLVASTQATVVGAIPTSSSVTSRLLTLTSMLSAPRLVTELGAARLSAHPHCHDVATTATLEPVLTISVALMVSTTCVVVLLLTVTSVRPMSAAPRSTSTR